MKRYILLAIVLGLLMTFSLATSSFVEAKDIYEWNATANAWDKYTGTLNTATGAGSSTQPTTYFTVTANVSELLGVEFNSTTLTWTIKELPTQGDYVVAKLTHGKVNSFEKDVKMTVKDVDDLKAGTETIPTYYHFLEGGKTTDDLSDPDTQNPSTGSGEDGLGGWFTTSYLKDKIFATDGSGNYGDADWITDTTNGFDIWCMLRISKTTKKGLYMNTFHIILESL